MKEVQDKALVGPPKSMNPEFHPGYLNLFESEEIIRTTINQFTIQTSSIYTENRSTDLSLVTEVYNVHFDFNYSLLGSEERISEVKKWVSKAMTVTEYAADIGGSKILNKISSAGGVVQNILEKDYLALSEAVATTAIEKFLSNNNSFLTTLTKAAAPKIAGAAVSIASLSLTNSAPEALPDQKTREIENLKARTIGALLILFETNNKVKVGTDIKPTYRDNTNVAQPQKLELPE